MKQIASQLFLAGAVLLLLVSSCKKVDLGIDPIELDKKNPIARGAVGAHNPNVPEGYGAGEGEETEEVGTEGEEETTGIEGESEGATCDAVDYPIYAGAGGNDISKGTNVGTVSYSNDGVNLYVTTTFPGPTCPEELHLYAGSEAPAVGNGGLPFGQFPYKLDNASCGVHTFTVPLSDVFPGETDFCDKDISIVLHAAMGGVQTEDGTTDGETAIGYGDDTFGGSRWGWVATYSVCCDAPTTTSEAPDTEPYYGE